MGNTFGQIGMADLEQNKAEMQTLGQVLADNYASEMTPPPPGFEAKEQAPEPVEVEAKEDDIEEITVEVKDEHPVENPVTPEEIDEVLNQEAELEQEEETPSEPEVKEEVEEPKTTENATDVSSDLKHVNLEPLKQLGKRSLRTINFKQGTFESPYFAKINNKGLVGVWKNFLATGGVDEECAIPGVSLRNENNAGIWMEGGATRVDGHVLIVADANGNQVTPLAVSPGVTIVNGKNALVMVEPGYYILMGCSNRKKFLLGLYRVDSVKFPESKQETPVFNCTMLSVVVYGQDDGNKQLVYESINDGGEKFTLEHPFFKAAIEQMNTYGARIPVYVPAYKSVRGNIDDLNRILGTKDVNENRTDFDNYDQLYSAVDKFSRETLWSLPSGHSIAIYTVLRLINNKLYAQVLVCSYNNGTKSLVKCLRSFVTRIDEDYNNFRYIGSDDVAPYSRLKSEVAGQDSNNILVAAHRCLVPSKIETTV